MYLHTEVFPQMMGQTNLTVAAITLTTAVGRIDTFVEYVDYLSAENSIQAST